MKSIFAPSALTLSVLSASSAAFASGLNDMVEYQAQYHIDPKSIAVATTADFEGNRETLYRLEMMSVEGQWFEFDCNRGSIAESENYCSILQARIEGALRRGGNLLDAMYVISPNWPACSAETGKRKVTYGVQFRWNEAGYTSPVTFWASSTVAKDCDWNP